jgi:hypothetical protein
MGYIVNQDGEVLSPESIMKERYLDMKSVFEEKIPYFISKLSARCNWENLALQIHENGDEYVFVINGSQACVLRFDTDRVIINN